LPFTLKDLQNAIPAHCFQPSALRSLYFFGKDVAIVLLLYFLAYKIDSTLFLPIFWFCQGLMFWALFVVGHDCGHGSFSSSPELNSVIGHLSHTPLLVPFYPWAYTHRLHHGSTGHQVKDEVYRAMKKANYTSLDWVTRLIRFEIFLIGFPFYLIYRDTSKSGNHYNPKSDMFVGAEKGKAFTSAIWIYSFIILLGVLTVWKGFTFVFVYWGVPWVLFVVWISLVTYLQHTDVRVPWYSSKEWTFLKGALSTIDRDFGPIVNYIHHNIETHVAHHLFSNIPHYYLLEATAAIKPILGQYYRKSNQGIIQGFISSYYFCRFVPDEGDVLYYNQGKGKRTLQ